MEQNEENEKLIIELKEIIKEYEKRLNTKDQNFQLQFSELQNELIIKCTEIESLTQAEREAEFLSVELRGLLQEKNSVISSKDSAIKIMEADFQEQMDNMKSLYDETLSIRREEIESLRMTTSQLREQLLLRETDIITMIQRHEDQIIKMYQDNNSKDLSSTLDHTVFVLKEELSDVKELLFQKQKSLRVASMQLEEQDKVIHHLQDQNTCLKDETKKLQKEIRFDQDTQKNQLNDDTKENRKKQITLKAKVKSLEKQCESLKDMLLKEQEKYSNFNKESDIREQLIEKQNTLINELRQTENSLHQNLDRSLILQQEHIIELSYWQNIKKLIPEFINDFEVNESDMLTPLDLALDTLSREQEIENLQMRENIKTTIVQLKNHIERISVQIIRGKKAEMMVSYLEKYKDDLHKYNMDIHKLLKILMTKFGNINNNNNNNNNTITSCEMDINNVDYTNMDNYSKEDLVLKIHILATNTVNYTEQLSSTIKENEELLKKIAEMKEDVLLKDKNGNDEKEKFSIIILKNEELLKKIDEMKEDVLLKEKSREDERENTSVLIKENEELLKEILEIKEDILLKEKNRDDEKEKFSIIIKENEELLKEIDKMELNTLLKEQSRLEEKEKTSILIKENEELLKKIDKMKENISLTEKSRDEEKEKTSILIKENEGLLKEIVELKEDILLKEKNGDDEKEKTSILIKENEELLKEIDEMKEDILLKEKSRDEEREKTSVLIKENEELLKEILEIKEDILLKEKSRFEEKENFSILIRENEESLKKIDEMKENILLKENSRDEEREKTSILVKENEGLLKEIVELKKDILLKEKNRNDEKENFSILIKENEELLKKITEIKGEILIQEKIRKEEREHTLKLIKENEELLNKIDGIEELLKQIELLKEQLILLEKNNSNNQEKLIFTNNENKDLKEEISFKDAAVNEVTEKLRSQKIEKEEFLKLIEQLKRDIVLKNYESEVKYGLCQDSSEEPISVKLKFEESLITKDEHCEKEALMDQEDNAKLKTQREKQCGKCEVLKKEVNSLVAEIENKNKAVEKLEKINLLLKAKSIKLKKQFDEKIESLSQKVQMKPSPTNENVPFSSEIVTEVTDKSTQVEFFASYSSLDDVSGSDEISFMSKIQSFSDEVDQRARKANLEIEEFLERNDQVTIGLNSNISPNRRIVCDNVQCQRTSSKNREFSLTITNLQQQNQLMKCKIIDLQNCIDYEKENGKKIIEENLEAQENLVKKLNNFSADKDRLKKELDSSLCDLRLSQDLLKNRESVIDKLNNEVCQWQKCNERETISFRLKEKEISSISEVVSKKEELIKELEEQLCNISNMNINLRKENENICKAVKLLNEEIERCITEDKELALISDFSMLSNEEVSKNLITLQENVIKFRKIVNLEIKNSTRNSNGIEEEVKRNLYSLDENFKLELSEEITDNDKNIELGNSACEYKNENISTKTEKLSKKEISVQEKEKECCNSFNISKDFENTREILKTLNKEIEQCIMENREFIPLSDFSKFSNKEILENMIKLQENLINFGRMVNFKFKALNLDSNIDEEEILMSIFTLKNNTRIELSKAITDNYKNIEDRCCVLLESNNLLEKDMLNMRERLDGIIDYCENEYKNELIAIKKEKELLKHSLIEMERKHDNFVQGTERIEVERLQNEENDVELKVEYLREECMEKEVEINNLNSIILNLKKEYGKDIKEEKVCQKCLRLKVEMENMKLDFITSLKDIIPNSKAEFGNDNKITLTDYISSIKMVKNVQTSIDTSHYVKIEELVNIIKGELPFSERRVERNELELWNDIIKEMRNYISKLKEEHRLEEQEKMEISDKFERLFMELESSCDLEIEGLKSTISSLNKEIVTLRDDREISEKMLLDYRVQLSENRPEKEELVQLTSSGTSESWISDLNDALKETISEKEDHITELMDQINDCSIRFRESIVKNEQQMSKMQELEKEIGKLIHDRNLKEKLIEENNCVINELEAVIVEKENRINLLEKESSEINVQLEQYIGAVCSMQARLEATKPNLELILMKIDNKDKNMQLLNLIDQLEKDYAEELEQSEINKSKIESKLNKAIQIIHKLKKQLKESHNKEMKLSEELRTVKLQCHCRKISVVLSENKPDDAEGYRGGLLLNNVSIQVDDEELSLLREENLNYKGIIENLHVNNFLLWKELDSVKKTERNTRGTSLPLMNSSALSCTNESERSSSPISQLSCNSFDGNSTNSNQIKDLQRKLQRVNQQLNQMRIERNRIHQEYSRIRQLKEIGDCKISELMKKIDFTEDHEIILSEKEELIKSNNQYLTEIAEFKSEIEMSKIRQSILETKCKKIEMKLSTQRRKYDQLLLKLDEKEQEIDRNSDEFRRNISNFEKEKLMFLREKKEMKSLLLMKEEKIGNLRKSLLNSRSNEMENCDGDYLLEINQLESQLNEQILENNRIVTRHREQLVKCQGQIEELIDDNRQLKRKLSSCCQVEGNNSIVSQSVEKKSKMEVIEEDSRETNGILASVVLEKEKLFTEILELSSALENLKDKLLKAEQEIGELKGQRNCENCEFLLKKKDSEVFKDCETIKVGINLCSKHCQTVQFNEYNLNEDILLRDKNQPEEKEKISILIKEREEFSKKISEMKEEILTREKNRADEREKTSILNKQNKELLKKMSVMREELLLEEKSRYEEKENISILIKKNDGLLKKIGEMKEELLLKEKNEYEENKRIANLVKENEDLLEKIIKMEEKKRINENEGIVSLVKNNEELLKKIDEMKKDIIMKEKNQDEEKEKIRDEEKEKTLILIKKNEELLKKISETKEKNRDKENEKIANLFKENENLLKKIVKLEEEKSCIESERITSILKDNKELLKKNDKLKEDIFMKEKNQGEEKEQIQYEEKEKNLILIKKNEELLKKISEMKELLLMKEKIRDEENEKIVNVFKENEDLLKKIVKLEEKSCNESERIASILKDNEELLKKIDEMKKNIIMKANSENKKNMKISELIKENEELLMKIKVSKLTSSETQTNSILGFEQFVKSGERISRSLSTQTDEDGIIKDLKQEVKDNITLIEQYRRQLTNSDDYIRKATIVKKELDETLRNLEVMEMKNLEYQEVIGMLELDQIEKEKKDKETLRNLEVMEKKNLEYQEVIGMLELEQIEKERKYKEKIEKLNLEINKQVEKHSNSEIPLVEVNDKSDQTLLCQPSNEGWDMEWDYEKLTTEHQQVFIKETMIINENRSEEILSLEAQVIDKSSENLVAILKDEANQLKNIINEKNLEIGHLKCLRNKIEDELVESDQQLKDSNMEFLNLKENIQVLHAERDILRQKIEDQEVHFSEIVNFTEMITLDLRRLRDSSGDSKSLFIGDDDIQDCRVKKVVEALEYELHKLLEQLQIKDSKLEDAFFQVEQLTCALHRIQLEKSQFDVHPLEDMNVQQNHSLDLTKNLHEDCVNSINNLSELLENKHLEIEGLKSRLFLATDQLIHFRTFFANPENKLHKELLLVTRHHSLDIQEVKSGKNDSTRNHTKLQIDSDDESDSDQSIVSHDGNTVIRVERSRFPSQSKMSYGSRFLTDILGPAHYKKFIRNFTRVFSAGCGHVVSLRSQPRINIRTIMTVYMVILHLFLLLCLFM